MKEQDYKRNSQADMKARVPRTGRLKSTLPILVLLSVIPAQAGIQFSSPASWIPVFTGMTIQVLDYSDVHGRPHFNTTRDISPVIDRPFRIMFASPQGEGLPPSPRGHEPRSPRKSVLLKADSVRRSSQRFPSSNN